MWLSARSFPQWLSSMCCIASLFPLIIVKHCVTPFSSNNSQTLRYFDLTNFPLPKTKYTNNNFKVCCGNKTTTKWKQNSKTNGGVCCISNNSMSNQFYLWQHGKTYSTCMIRHSQIWDNQFHLLFSRLTMNCFH